MALYIPHERPSPITRVVVRLGQAFALLTLLVLHDQRDDADE